MWFVHMFLFDLFSFLHESKMLGGLPYPLPAEHSGGGMLECGEPIGTIILWAIFHVITSYTLLSLFKLPF